MTNGQTWQKKWISNRLGKHRTVFFLFFFLQLLNEIFAELFHLSHAFNPAQYNAIKLIVEHFCQLPNLAHQPPESILFRRKRVTFWFCFHPTSGRFQEVGGQPAYRDPEKPDQSGPAQGMSVALFFFLDRMSVIEKFYQKHFRCVLISPHLFFFLPFINILAQAVTEVLVKCKMSPKIETTRDLLAQLKHRL